MLKAPFPYFGGKLPVAKRVWRALGQPKHYIEPCFGSGAVLLARPGYQAGVHIETVNDADGHLANVWRSLQHDPDEVAKWCDWPVNHADLSARKRKMIGDEQYLLDNLSQDDEWRDPKLAGYWIWAASCWIGSGLTFLGQRPNLTKGGTGVHALGQIPHVGHGGRGVQEPYNTNIYEWFRQLAERLRYVRVVCGDWSRVCGGDWQDGGGDVGIFFDPPYSQDVGRNNGLYHRDEDIAKDVAQWCAERGDRPTYRIVLAGYDGEHEWLVDKGWRRESWKAQGGYGNRGGPNENRKREVLWYSPHCLRDGTMGRLL